MKHDIRPRRSNHPTREAKVSTILVRARPLHPPRVALGGRLLPIVMLVLACAFSGEVRAASVRGSDSFDAESHAQSCKCGAKCRGASCCCGSRKPKAVAKPTTPVVGLPRPDLSENPCLNSAPCHDPILPTAAPVGSSGKIAALASFEPPPARVGRRMLPTPPSHLSSDRRAFRLDRPPKALGSA